VGDITPPTDAQQSPGSGIRIYSRTLLYSVALALSLAVLAVAAALAWDRMNLVIDNVQRRAYVGQLEVLKNSRLKLIYSLEQTARLHSRLLSEQRQPDACDAGMADGADSAGILFPGELGAMPRAGSKNATPAPPILNTLSILGDTGCPSRERMLQKLSRSLASSVESLWDYPEISSYTFDPEGRFLAHGVRPAHDESTSRAAIQDEIAAATAHFQPGMRHLRETAPTSSLPFLAGVRRQADTGNRVLSIGAPIYSGKDRLFAVTAIDIERSAFDKIFMPAGRLPGFFVFDASHATAPVLLNDIGAGERALVQSIFKHWRFIHAAAHDLSVIEIGRRFYFVEAVGGTPWVAVYGFDFGDVLMRSESLWIGFSMFGTLLLLWGGVYLVNRYVLAPLSLASQRIVASEELNRTIIATAPVGLCMLDLQTAQTLLSNDLARTYARRWGRRPDLARSILDAYDAIVGQDAPARDSNTVLYTELPAPQEIGAPPLLAAFSHVRYQEREVLLCGLSDVTMHKEAEAMLQQARRNADEANEAKSMFLATISHEIRTPLHGAMGNLELLEKTNLSPSQRSTINTISRAFFSLLQIINNVLDLSKAGAGQLHLSADIVDLVGLLEDVALTFAPCIAKKEVQFLCLIDSRLPKKIHGDEARLRQIFNNLLSNAVKFTGNGKIVMRADLSALEAGDCAFTVQIADSGIGISERGRSKLFMPFQQANNAIAGTFGGTGLGLSLVKNLCDAMGGAIEVDSRQHHGASFTVSLKLPVFDSTEQNAEEIAAKPLANVAVALCCDDPLWRRHLCLQLESGGATVFEAGAGADATPIHCDTLLIACQDGQEKIYLPQLAVYPRARHVMLTPLGPLPPEQRAGCIRISALSQRGLLPAVNPAFNVMHSWGHIVPPPHENEATRAIEPGDEARRRSDAICTSADRAERSAAAPYATAFNILLVEDDLVNVTLAQQQLAMLGYTDIALARNGQEALEKCGKQAFQLILTDQFMPEMDGNRLAAALREQAYPATIIMVTASRPSPVDRKNLDAVLLKPVSLEQLRNVLSCHCPPLQAAAPPTGQAILWNAFMQDYPDTIGALESALRTNNQAQCLRQLHKLKGALEILRQPLAKQVAALERLSMTTPIAELTDAYHALQQALDRLITPVRPE
jgi:two-component system capsular synthesis sensor histidine kinase RcsC